jgi:ABC-type nitrate/sulfonate/bicarbonate transport system substrate-binding protein
LAALAKSRAAEKRPIKIGVPTGSMQHLKLIVALRGAGIDPSREVEIVNIPFPTHPRAIDGGEVDLAMTLATFGAFSINGGKGTLFAHVFEGTAGKQEIGLAVHRDNVEKRPEYLQRVVASYVEVMKSFAQDTDKQIALELKYLKLPEPIVTMVQRDFLRLSYHTNVPDLILMARQMKEIGWSKKENSDQLDKFVDFTFIAKASGEAVDALKRW